MGDDFVRTELGFAPVRFEGHIALAEQWLVESAELRQKTSGLAFRDEKDLHKKCQDRSLEKWGNLVYGIQVDSDWVQVGNRYLPIRVSQKGVSYIALWRQDMAVLPWPSSGGTVRLCLLAPCGDYSVSGTFTGWGTLAEHCEDRFPLTDLAVPDILSKELKGKHIYYMHLPISMLQNAQFKFRLHEKGWITDSLRWEWEVNNRKILSDASFSPGANIFMAWGSKEATGDDMVDFLKVAFFDKVQKTLFGQVQKGFDNALRIVEEVEKSVLKVSCVHPSGYSQSKQFQSSISLALSQMFFRPDLWQLSPGLYVWAALQEHKRTGSLCSLHFLERLIEIFAVWPPQLTDHPQLADVHKTAQQALLESCRTGIPCKQWLQAAVQIILRCDPTQARQSWWPLVVETAGRVDSCCLLNWGAIQLEKVPNFTLDLALKVVLQPAVTARQVWFSATGFLDHFAHLRDQEVESVTACLALEEALIRHSRSDLMSWSVVASELQEFLDKLREGSCTEQLQHSLKTILSQTWKRCASRSNEIPECGQITQGLLLVAQAITADPQRVYFVSFERGSANRWLRLAAAVGSERYVSRLGVVMSSLWSHCWAPHTTFRMCSCFRGIYSQEKTCMHRPFS